MMAVMSEPEQATEVSLRDLYRQHRWDLVRLASLLVHHTADAEEVVQDAFVKTLVAWDRMRDKGRALPYLRSAVLNGARSRLRHRRVVERTDTGPGAGVPAPSPEQAAIGRDEQDRMLAALRSLPTRQRECLVLRYYLDLSEAEIAATLDISAGSVKTHVHRGMAALAGRLEEDQ
jgi:RNA polymerase sigma-70 factor (sigma-E family)